jgi:gliding motility-associated-like protein
VKAGGRINTTGCGKFKTEKIITFKGLFQTTLFYLPLFFVKPPLSWLANLKQLLMQLRLFFLIFIFLLAISIVGSTQNFTPVTVTGFNEDAIAETGPSSLATTSNYLDAITSNKVMYTNAFKTFAGIAGGGLPDNGAVTSGNMSFQLASYNTTNALCIFRNQSASLNLTTPASFTKLRILCFSTEANVAPSNALVNISLSFTDGTTTPYITNYGLSDWFNGATNIVTSGFGRCSRVASAPWGDEAYPINPRMYYIEIILNCTETQKLLQQITFSNVTTAGSNAPFPNEVFLAVSGVSYSQTIIPTITPCDCAGPNGSIALNITGTNSPYSFSWNTTPVQTGSTATGLSPGNYSCTITDANGCALVYNGTVPLNNTASIIAVANPNFICLGPFSTSTLTANVTGGLLTTFIWTPGNLNGQSVTVSPIITTTYTVNGTNALGCTASGQVTVSWSSLGWVPIVNDATVCNGSTATLQVQNLLPGLVFKWYDAPTGGNLLATGINYITPPILSPTVFYVEAVSPTGCTSLRKNVTVSISPLPLAPLIDDVSICLGDNVTLSVSNPQNNFIYKWYDAPMGGTLLNTGNSYSLFNVSSSDTYFVEAINAIGCNSNQRTPVNITLLSPLPEPLVTVSNITQTSMSFSWLPVSGANSYQISIDGGNFFQTPSSGPTGTTHIITGLNLNTTITLQVKVIGPRICQNRLSQFVSGTTLSSKEIFVPNVFTPNNDGKNDVLFVYGNYISTIQFNIFDQWGELIFSTKSITTGWDGIYKGKQQPVGVYVYTLKVLMLDGSVINKKGSVNLIR